MRSHPLVYFSIIFVLAFRIEVALASSCNADGPYYDIPKGEARITEFALLFSPSDCPTQTISLNGPIQKPHGVPLYFWFRLQGDSAYLDTPASAKSLFLRISLFNGSFYVVQKTIDMGPIRIDDVLIEIDLTPDSTFDWRLNANKEYLPAPGLYRASIVQRE